MALPCCQQPEQQSLSGSKKDDVKPARLLAAEHEMFVQRVIVSAGMCFVGKG